MATEAAVAERADTRAKTKKKAPKAQGGTPWWMWIAVAAIVVFCLFPFYWLVNLSLKTGADLGDSSLFPPQPDARELQVDLPERRLHAVAAQQRDHLARRRRRSRSLVGSFCAYALARLRFGGKFVILALVLSITTFPAIAIAAPLFRLWRTSGIFNTLIGLIIPNLTFALPLAIYILVSFFKEIPKDLEEAALVDGATHFMAFRKVVVPLAAPGLATAGILTFIATWNEFLLAITLTSSPAARPVPAAIAFFTGSTQFEIPYGTITAASVTISVPLILLVLFFQKRIVAGLTAGAVKG